MSEDMRTECMELCVTACEKHAANNEVGNKIIILSQFIYSNKILAVLDIKCLSFLL